MEGFFIFLFLLCEVLCVSVTLWQKRFEQIEVMHWGHALGSCETSHCNREIFHLIDDTAVDGEEAVGADEAAGVVDFGNHGFDGDFLVGGENLAAINPGTVFFVVGDGLEVDRI